MRTWIVLALLMGAVSLMGCQDDAEPAPEPEAETCVAGETRACTCTNGLEGAQTCQDDGQSYGICQCQTLPPSPDAGDNNDPQDAQAEDAADDLGEEDADPPQEDADGPEDIQDPEDAQDPDADEEDAVQEDAPQPPDADPPDRDADDDRNNDMGPRTCETDDDCQERGSCPPDTSGPCICFEHSRGNACTPSCQTAQECQDDQECDEEDGICRDIRN